MWIFRKQQKLDSDYDGYISTGKYEVGWVNYNQRPYGFYALYVYDTIEEAEQKVHYLNGGN
jgi:ABC-type molybdate transport system substrate-binding protein